MKALSALNPYSDGVDPFGLIQSADGNFYGITHSGGTSNLGTVFQLTPTGTEVILHSFSGIDGDGATPENLVLGMDGNFYGTTQYGGNSNNGSVFRITPAGVLTTLYSFDGEIADGGNPFGLIQGADGNFYGSTAPNFVTNGTVFELTPSGALTTLHTFSGLSNQQTNADGVESVGLHQSFDGSLYGITTSGGAYGQGTAFTISTAGEFNVLTSFHSYCSSFIRDMTGNYYGTTEYDGASRQGTFFGISTTGAFTVLHNFTGGSDGSNPGDLIKGNDGNFYGTTGDGGGSVGHGKVFRMTPAGEITTLHDFDINTEGAYPNDLVLAQDGNFYGLTGNGGPDGGGTFFCLTETGVLSVLTGFVFGDDPDDLFQGADGTFYCLSAGGGQGEGAIYSITSAGTRNILHSFLGDPTGDGPVSVVQANDGSFYGATTAGGQNNTGTIFHLTPSGTLTTLYSFSALDTYLENADGAEPNGLIQANDGNFYGVTEGGGVAARGTIIKITAAGVFTNLYSFTGSDGAQPSGGLVQANDGNFYGMTYSGGSDNAGTVYRLTVTGELTSLYNFTGVNGDGSYPGGKLLQSPDGSFYGVTTGGGMNGDGTIFNITPDGKLVILYSFTGGNDGTNPSVGLTLGSDGNYYGTASGGATGAGTLYRINSAGTFTLLYNFQGGYDGSLPVATLVLGEDGNLYGATSANGRHGDGTFFQLTTAGGFTTLYSISGATDGDQVSSFVLGVDGNLYGTSGGGGANDVGTVFAVAVMPPSAHPAFFTGEAALSEGVYYLQFPNGNLFGYYEFLSDPNYIYHFDLGFEYVFDANDGQSGVYFYDFKSSTFFYTSPTFPFPYLYDFSLNTFLYYYPDPNNSGHYNTDGVRYFYDFNTGTIIVK